MFSKICKVLVTGLSSFQAMCSFSEDKLIIIRAILSTKDSL